MSHILYQISGLLSVVQLFGGSNLISSTWSILKLLFAEKPFFAIWLALHRRKGNSGRATHNDELERRKLNAQTNQPSKKRDKLDPPSLCLRMAYCACANQRLVIGSFCNADVITYYQNSTLSCLLKYLERSYRIPKVYPGM